MTINKLIVFAETGDKNTDDLNLSQGFPSKLQPARQWHNWLFNKITLKINELIDAVIDNGADTTSKFNGIDTEIDNINLSITGLNDARIGSITQWLSISIPDDSLEMKGQTINKIDHPKLFQAYGISADTLTLPDTRGEFVRGFDNGRGVDADRQLGSSQADMLKAHTHNMKVKVNGATTDSTLNDVVKNSDTGQTLTTESTGGTETRPRNIAMIYIIKVK